MRTETPFSSWPGTTHSWFPVTRTASWPSGYAPLTQDLNSCKPIKKAQAHGGGVAAIHLFSDRVDTHLICTGGINDGVVNVFDMRTNKPVFSEQLHKGAVNQLATDLSGNSSLHSPVLTCSADKTCKILDPLAGFKLRGQLLCKDAVYCIANVYNLTVAGCGDGNLLFFDNDTQKCLYG